VGDNFTREQMSVEEAFAEGEREALARIPVDDVRRQFYLPCVGGPHDGNLLRVPTWMLQTKHGSGDEPTLEVPASRSGLQDHVPYELRQFAQYRLDRSSRVLRYTRTDTIGGLLR
jgi:hypothetical protein